MRRARIWMMAAPLVLVPGLAAAEDVHSDSTKASATSAASTDECMQRCNAECLGATDATGQTTTQKTKKGKRAAKSSSSGQSAMSTTDGAATTPYGSTTSGLGSSSTSADLGSSDLSGAAAYDQATLDGIRAEERARASEEMSAQEQRLSEEHKAELERVREEERAAAQSQLAQARAADQARMDQEIADARDDDVIKDAVLTPVGLYGFLGGGATNFTQPDAVGATSAGGYWDARIGIGSRSILGAEVAYNGSARDIQALGLDNDAYLLSNGVEAIARLNVPITPENVPVLFEPYTFAGAGWQHFTLMNEGNNTSDVRSNDDVMTVPLGFGMAFGFSGVTLDGRLTYRQTIGADLLGTSTSSFDETSLNSWGAGGAIGFEF